MIEIPPCPRCRSTRVVEGRLGTQATAFYPAGLRFLTWVKGLPLPIRGWSGSQGFGCVSCGLVWSEVSAAKLRRMMWTGGTEETRRLIRDAESELLSGED